MHSDAFDLELRLIERSRNAFRLYGLTACTTLFGQPCPRIQWGRIGERPHRELSTGPAAFGVYNARKQASANPR